MMLKDAPGGPEFVQNIMDAVQDLALLYAHTPDECARPHLEGYIDRIKPGIIEAVGADNAPKLLNAIRCATMTHKHTIEAGGRGLA
jgi:hypothetical protein